MKDSCVKGDCQVIWRIIIVTWLAFVHHTNGQGRMLDPPGRSSLWILGYDTPINYNDNSLSCGGVQRQWGKNDGRCGICGDPWDMVPRDHESGGRFATGIVTRDYTSGATMNVTLDVAVNNGGYFEFRLCPQHDLDVHETEACLEAGLLTVVGESGPVLKYEAVQEGENTVHVSLPPGVTCSQCLLQWKYTTADHYGCELDPNGHERCCVGCGEIQTTYYACADIAIVDSGTTAGSKNDTKTSKDLLTSSGDKNIHDKPKIRTKRGVFHRNRGFRLRNPFDPGRRQETRQIVTTYRPTRVQFTTFSPGVITSSPETIWNWQQRSSRGISVNGRGGRMFMNSYPRRLVGLSSGHSITVGGVVPTDTMGNAGVAASVNVSPVQFTGPQPQAAFVRVEEPDPVPVFHAVENPSVQVGRKTPVKGSCKSIGPFRSAAMDDWCNRQCGTGPCIINQCSCPGQTTEDTCNKCPFGICWDDKKMSVDDLFPGLFADPMTFLQCKELDKLYILKTYKVISEGLPECTHPRFRRQAPLQIDDDDFGCCATRPQVIMPLKVESDNDTYDVVQLPRSKNQFLVRGECRQNATTTCGSCSAEMNFQWVLVYDRKLRMRPPVKFVPVKFAHYCRCRNPGIIRAKKGGKRLEVSHKEVRTRESRTESSHTTMGH